MTNHEHHDDNAAAYLLGALSELEAEAFERHIMGCADCRDEVERLRPAADALPRAVSQVTPPPGLKASLMREVRGAEAQPATSRRPARRLRSLRARPAMAWVSAAFIILAGVLAGYGGARLLDEDEAARTLAADVDRSRVPGAGASLIVPEDGEVGVLSVHGLRPVPGDQVYVVWAQRGTEVIFESSFNVRPDGSGKAAIEGIAGLDRVMVTRERSPGAVAPGEDPILTVDTS
jgi:anti-sigma factor RsiW